MTTYNKIIKLFLAPIIAVLVCTAVTGCKDDEGRQPRTSRRRKHRLRVLL